MRLIRPHGRSVVGPGPGARRVLVLKRDETVRTELAVFAAHDPALVIGQFASQLDKVLRKPDQPDRAPPQALRDLRDRLGQALWPHLGLREGHRIAWMARVHPYPDQGKPWKGPVQGRWYGRFGDPATDPQAVAAAIADHLRHHARTASAQRANPATTPASRQGLIAHRAASITANTLVRQKDRQIDPLDEDEAWSRYQADALMVDIAAIRAEADREAAARNPLHSHGKPRWTALAACLYAHYARVFGPTAKPADLQGEPVFAIHQAVKAYWRRCLKEGSAQPERLAQALPKDGAGLRAVVCARQRNRQTMAQTRLGKIIHYQACERGDGPATNWPNAEAVAESAFWGSAGQTGIKQQEALARVWRRVLALAQRSLTDWCPSEDGEETCDILEGKAAPSADPAKTALLFGEQAGLFASANPAPRAKAILADLRNSVFHFKRLTILLDALEKTADGAETALWQADRERRTALLGQRLHTVEAPFFLEPALLTRVVALAQGREDLLQLPRFNRVVARGAATLKDFPLAPVNRRQLEESAELRCRYSVLKLLYETGFRQWAAHVAPAKLHHALNAALERGSRAARQINGDTSPGGLPVSSRAAKLLAGVTPPTELSKLMEWLSAETASEMRVQAFYHHDRVAARQQTAFIDTLLCDVLAHLFLAFLSEQDLGGLARQLRRHATPAPLPAIHCPADTAPAWAASLYFIVHLVPVEDIGQLLHQLRRWQAAREAAKPQHAETETRITTMVAQMIAVLGLYLDCHDAKFAGGPLHGGLLWEDWQLLFADRQCFEAVFPAHSDDSPLPLRGLREMRRFGGLAPLASVIATNPIGAAELSEWQALGQNIAALQARREELHHQIARGHGKWRKLPADQQRADLRDYTHLVETIARHRHLTARVTLGEVVRLHRLMMAVLARLLDFAGLWERDHYFQTLAGWNQSGEHADLTPKHRDLLNEGRFLHVMKKRKTKLPGATARNNFAHFNPLHGRPRLDLTALVNQTRTLMAYDRKLKNAVPGAVADIVATHGLELHWRAGHDHQLTLDRLRVTRAHHLGKADWKGLGVNPPCEPLASDSFRQWVWRLFGGEGPAKS